MALPEARHDSRWLAASSVTAERSARSETEPSQQSLLSTPSEANPPGISFDGFIKHYEIIRKLGEGGMGIVLLARDTKLGRLVAIKLLRDCGRGTLRMLAEAQTTARCRHESIVTIYDVDEIDGQPYMVLEYLDGRTLRDVLAAGDRGPGRALPKGLALDIVMAVTRALTAAHEHDIVHLEWFASPRKSVLGFQELRLSSRWRWKRINGAISVCTKPGLRRSSAQSSPGQHLLDPVVNRHRRLWITGLGRSASDRLAIGREFPGLGFEHFPVHFCGDDQ